MPERDAPGKLESKRKVGGKLGEEEPAMGPPLSVPLPLKYDISEAAGAPQKKWRRNGNQWGVRAEGHRGLERVNLAEGVRKEIKKAPGVCLLPTEA